MAGFVRTINGSPTHFPNLFPTEVEDLNRVFDRFEERIAELQLEIEALKAENHELRNLVQAKVGYAYIVEQIEQIRAKAVVIEPKKRRIFGLPIW